MSTYPMNFTVHVDSSSGMQQAWTASSTHFNHEIPMAIPPEFSGPGNGLSPEDLYALALQNCFVATFKVFAEKSKLNYTSITGSTNLEVDRDQQGHPWMARIHFKFHLQGVTQVANALRLLERTSQNCMILNSVKTEKTFEFEVNNETAREMKIN